MHEHALSGCRPVPLAHYLKALGIVRLVAKQADAGARGFWASDHFVLQTQLDRPALERFFLEVYAPTPVVAPWNGGSGFHPKDNHAAIEAIGASPAERLAGYRVSIERCHMALQRLHIIDKVTKGDKQTLLEACRGSLPDPALDWLDAAFVLTNDGAKYPPLLGTGGNDGRLDFTNNFMQRLLDLIEPFDGSPRPTAASLLSAALFDEPTDLLVKGAAIGQFLPNRAGGANASSGFDADSLINPWDFVLMLEGAVMFAAAAVRKLEEGSHAGLSYPFTVRQVGAGYASATSEDEASARAEMWMPLWGQGASQQGASIRELRALFSEGRARVGKRAARNGVDFARAIAALGVDRGIGAFERYGFQVRNGLAYFAVPLGRAVVRAQPSVGLLEELDGWLYGFRRAATAANAPASARRALTRLDRAILQLCERGDPVRVSNTLLALGRCERVLATRTRWAEDSRLSPLPPLAPAWLTGANDGSVEFRLAVSMASLFGVYRDRARDGQNAALRFRSHLEPVRTWQAGGRLRVEWATGAQDVAWEPSDLVGSLNAILARRLAHAVRSGHEAYADRGRAARLSDIAAFIEGRVDERHLADLLCSCALVDWVRAADTRLPGVPSDEDQTCEALFALLKLCFAAASVRQASVPIVSQIHHLAALGHGARAAQQAIRRLRGSNLAPAFRTLHVEGQIAHRSAAALLFPIGPQTVGTLEELVLRPNQLAAGATHDHSEDSKGINP